MDGGKDRGKDGWGREESMRPQGPALLQELHRQLCCGRGDREAMGGVAVHCSRMPRCRGEGDPQV